MSPGLQKKMLFSVNWSSPSHHQQTNFKDIRLQTYDVKLTQLTINLRSLDVK